MVLERPERLCQKYMALVKYNLSRSIPTQIDQGNNVVVMSSDVMPPTEPLIVTLQTANTDLLAKHAAAMEAKLSLIHSRADLHTSAQAQRTAFNNLGGLVQTDSDGNAAYITSCGYGVRSNGTPAPPVEDPPEALRTQVNGTPGQVLFSWKAPVGARYFEAQSTTELSGETGWVTAGEMPTKTKISFTDLTSGTRYAFRVRAWGNGLPGPWSTPVQQMVL
jgi:hypothetical protein